MAVISKLASISQPLTGFVPGVSYTIRFLASQRQQTVAQLGNTVDVCIDGQPIAKLFPFQMGSGYIEYKATFVASAANHTLSFVGTNRNGGSNDVFLDRVLIIENLSGVDLRLRPTTRVRRSN